MILFINIEKKTHTHTHTKKVLTHNGNTILREIGIEHYKPIRVSVRYFLIKRLESSLPIDKIMTTDKF